jgi:hypothetical protein
LYKAVGWDQASQTYTGKTEPVKWVRIHNLPDFVYFNHAQHVTVAGIECQTVTDQWKLMKFKQFAPLTMDGVLIVTEKTEVKMEGNEYYN